MSCSCFIKDLYFWSSNERHQVFEKRPVLVFFYCINRLTSDKNLIQGTAAANKGIAPNFSFQAFFSTQVLSALVYSNITACVFRDILKVACHHRLFDQLEGTSFANKLPSLRWISCESLSVTSVHGRVRVVLLALWRIWPIPSVPYCSMFIKSITNPRKSFVPKQLESKLTKRTSHLETSFFSWTLQSKAKKAK